MGNRTEMKKSHLPLALWYGMSAMLMGSGCFCGYAGLKLFEAHFQLSVGLFFMGTVMSLWGLMVFRRCLS